MIDDLASGGARHTKSDAGEKAIGVANVMRPWIHRCCQRIRGGRRCATIQANGLCHVTATSILANHWLRQHTTRPTPRKDQRMAGLVTAAKEHENSRRCEQFCHSYRALLMNVLGQEARRHKIG